MEKENYEEFNLEKLTKLRETEMNNKTDGFKYEYEKKNDNNLVIFVPKLNYNEYDFHTSKEFFLRLYFRESIIKNFGIRFNITKSDIESVDFNDCNFNTNIISGINENATFIYNQPSNLLKKFQIDYSNNSNKGGILIFYNFLINNFIIKNSNNKYVKFDRIKIYNNEILKNLLLENINIGELDLRNINNNFESFEIRNCVIDKLVIRNSNLGKAVFNGVIIKHLEIENATLNDCIFNGVDFNDNYRLIDVFSKNKLDLKVMKDNYRQLKHVMDKNANYTEANQFYALEMEYYMKTLNISKDISFLSLFKEKFFGKDSKNISEKIILKLSYIINEYGNNPIRNIMLIISYLLLSFIAVFSINNSTLLLINYLGINNIALGHIFSVIISIFMLYLFLKNNKIKKILDNKKIEKIMGILLIISFSILLLHGDTVRFYGIHTLVYLINPFSGLTYNSINTLIWSEQIGMILHKIIYGTLIYQLIIALKRTTKR